MSGIGDRIKEVRGELSQKEFAKKLGIAQSHISMIEKGIRIPASDTLISFLKNFNININWLLTGEGIKYYTLGDNNKNAMITQLQTALNEKDKQLQRVRDAAQITESETQAIRAAEIIIATEVSEKSKLKKK